MIFGFEFVSYLAKVSKVFCYLSNYRACNRSIQILFIKISQTVACVRVLSPYPTIIKISIHWFSLKRAILSNNCTWLLICQIISNYMTYIASKSLKSQQSKIQELEKKENKHIIECFTWNKKIPQNSKPSFLVVHLCYWYIQ